MVKSNPLLTDAGAQYCARVEICENNAFSVNQKMLQLSDKAVKISSCWGSEQRVFVQKIRMLPNQYFKLKSNKHHLIDISLASS